MISPLRGVARIALVALAGAGVGACGGVQQDQADATVEAGARDAAAEATHDATVHRDAASDTGDRDAGDAASDRGLCISDAGPSPVTTPLCFVGGWCWAEPTPFGEVPNGIWGSSAHDVWIVGEGGAIVHWDGTAFASVASGTTEGLRRTWGSGPGAAWAVGNNGTILRWDGSAWSAEDAGSQANLLSVWGTGPADVWAVGERGAILHWNGSAWSPSPSGTTTDLYGAWASSPSNAWAVGGYSRPSVVLHWSGEAWSTASLSENDAGWPGSVWGTGPSDVWVGFSAFTNVAFGAHFDGSTWREYVVDDAGNAGNLYGMTGGGPHDIYGAVVGGKNVGLRHWDGKAWRLVSSQVTPSQLWESAPNDVWGVGGGTFHYDGCAWTGSTIELIDTAAIVDENDALWVNTPTDIWAGGRYGLVFHYDGSTWKRFPILVSEENYDIIVALWGSGSDDVWAVGKETVDDFPYFHPAGSIYHWNGTRWAPSTGASIPSLFAHAVWGSAPRDVWVVGEARGTPTDGGAPQSVIEHWDGTVWSFVPSPSTTTLNGVWGSGSGDVWAVGDSGTIFHWAGSAWTTVTSPVTADLAGVWGTSTTDAWAVGASGTIVHWDGTSWKASPSGTTLPLTSVGGSGARNVWVGASVANPGDAQLLHWDGTSWSTAPPAWGSILAVAGLPTGDAGDVWAAGGWNSVPSVFHRKD